jgi:positive phototaxis protein PixI
MSTSTSITRLEQLLPQLFQGSSPEGKTYLRFQLTADIAAAISMDWVQESLLVGSEQISPLPNLPEAAIGIMSARNRIFCVFDLAQLLMLPSTLTSARQYHTIVVRANAGNLPADSFQSDNNSALLEERELFLGIAVDRIQGIARFTTDELQSPKSDFPAQLAPYLSGAVTEDDRQILILDIDSISDSARNLDR